MRYNVGCCPPSWRASITGSALNGNERARAPVHQRVHVIRGERADRAFHEQRNAGGLQPVDPALETRERPVDLRRRLVVRGVRAVDAHFHRERRSIGEETRDRLRHHRGVRVQRHEQSFRERVFVDRAEVATREDLPTGERQPEHTRPFDDVEHLARLRGVEVRALVRVQRDVAESAAKVAARRDLEET